MRRVAAVGHKAVDSSATLHLRTATDTFRETVIHFLNNEGRTESKKFGNSKWRDLEHFTLPISHI